MAKFNAFIKGSKGDQKRDSGGRFTSSRRYGETVTVQAPTRAQGKKKVEDTILPGERIVYIGPGEKGHKIPPARG